MRSPSSTWSASARAWSFRPGGSSSPAAWPTSRGAGVTVAVIDTGVRPHADLAANLLPGYDFVSNSSVANDGDGRDAGVVYAEMQGRENDLRASDALLALPAAGAAGRAVAPALKVSPELGGILGAGGGGFGYGYGVASEANAAGDRVTLPTQRSRSEFEQTYNVPRPVAPSIEDVVAKARKDYEDSAAYKDLIRQSKASVASKKAQDVADAARAGFGATQSASSRAASDWEAAREKAWAAEQGDYKSRLDAFQNQGFWDRNPEVKPYAIGAAYALPAIFGAGSAVQKGRTQQRLTDDILGSDVARATAAKGAADKLLNPTLGDQVKKGTATVLAAGAPFEIRSIGDAADATFAPEGSGAQTRARAHFADPGKYIMEGLPQLVSGAILYGTGAKAGSLATRDAKAMLSGAAGMDEAAINAAAAKKLAVINQQGVVDAAQREVQGAAVDQRLGTALRAVDGDAQPGLVPAGMLDQIGHRQQRDPHQPRLLRFLHPQARFKELAPK
mgnify:CR=1 FL=1